MSEIKSIILPTRPQPDTLVAIFLLKKYGEAMFPGVGDARVEVKPALPEGESTDSLLKKSMLAIDMGQGQFDHHDREPKTTASRLVAEYLDIHQLPAIQKLLQYAERDDFYGKGTISTDPLDRAFGLSGLISNLNRLHVDDPNRVIEVVTPLLEAHLAEEVRRTEEMPREFSELLTSGQAQDLEVKQRSKKLRVVVVTSGNRSLSGYLRSQLGGRYDVVAQYLPSGHLNILTRPTKNVQLPQLAALLRVEELLRNGLKPQGSPQQFERSGRLESVPNWYFDPATNSLLNGGPNPSAETKPTKISQADLPEILRIGLSEQVWQDAGR